MSEYSRRGNFVRIYPSKNSNIYDQYFNGTRPLNKLLYKVLYSNKLMPMSYDNSISPMKQTQHEENED